MKVWTDRLLNARAMTVTAWFLSDCRSLEAKTLTYSQSVSRKTQWVFDRKIKFVCGFYKIEDWLGVKPSGPARGPAADQVVRPTFACLQSLSKVGTVRSISRRATLVDVMRLLPILLLSISLANAADSRLQQNIERVTRSVNAQWGIYIKCLETGAEIAINADKQMDTMSVIKIPLMAEVFRQVEEGKFNLDDRVTLTDGAKRPGTGVMRSLDAGATMSIRDLLTLMTIVSDNTATDLLFDKVGGTEPVNKLMKSYGFDSVRATGPSSVWFTALRAAPSAAEFHRQAKTPFGLASPRDIGKLLERIAEGKAVSAKASETMLQMMRGQVYSSRLPKYVTGFRIAHKTGDFLPYIGNDVGIFESEKRRVVVSIFTSAHYGIGAQLEDAIARIGELIANEFAVDR